MAVDDLGNPIPDATSGGSSSPLSLGTLGMGAVGALGFGALLAQGPGQLPGQFGQLQGNVPGMEAEAGALEAQGGALVGQGTEALGMAQRGELTPEQQAQLKVYGTGLTNQARQQWAAMGRNPDEDTSFISQTANIDTQVNAMAQQQIQSSIALGLGETSAGTNLIGQGLGFSNAANQALITAGNAQIQQDKSYSDSLTSVFASVAKMAGAALPLLAASDIRLKHDIKPLGVLPNGLMAYSFRFKGDWVPYVGVIAQEVREVMPEAVSTGAGGMLYVDYGKVGMPFMTLADWKMAHERH